MAAEGSVGVPIGWLVAVGTALSGAVGALWREQVRRSKQTSDKLEKCEDKHEQTQGLVVELSSRVGRLEGLNEGKAEGVEELAQSIVDLVNRNDGN